jgi:hypothetical protein
MRVFKRGISPSPQATPLENYLSLLQREIERDFIIEIPLSLLRSKY